jgi:hypothetical protein
LPFKHFGVINVIAAVIAAQGDHTKMKYFTINTENNIAAHASKKAARESAASAFSTEVQLADLIGPDNKRLVAIWNSLPGVQPVTKFANRKVATERIWKAIQGLGEAPAGPAPAESVVAMPEAAATISEPVAEQTAEPTPNASPEHASESAPAQPAPETEQETVPAEELATVGAQEPDVAPAAAESNNETSDSKGSAPAKPKKLAKKAAKPAKTAEPKAEGPREGSKTAQVLEMLQRKGGATLPEIMAKMGWQKHTVRGFMAGAMKKAGYTVESFKPEGGERTYRINQ